MKNSADLVLGMEVHEAARGASLALKNGGTLVFPDVSWQPSPCAWAGTLKLQPER